MKLRFSTPATPLGSILCLLGFSVLMPVACGGDVPTSLSEEGISATGPGGGSLPANVNPLELGVRRAVDVRHIGVRLVTTEDQTQPIGQGTVQFLERILSDGNGQFALEPVGPYQANQPPAGNWATFSLLHILRQSLFVRYRDFEVRDVVAFVGEWSFRELGTQVTVAGRTCRRVDVVHVRTGRSYELSIDEETGLALDQRELDAQGQLLLQVTYQSLDLAPDLSNVVWYQPTPAIAYALDADLEQELGVVIRLPSNLPVGYDLSRIEYLDTKAKGDDTGPWLNVIYSNGVDPLFFAVNIPSALGAASAATGGTSLKVNRIDPTDSGSTMSAVSLGRASAGIVDLPTGLVFAVGRVGIEELADLIHSTIP